MNDRSMLRAVPISLAVLVSACGGIVDEEPEEFVEAQAATVANAKLTLKNATSTVAHTSAKPWLLTKTGANNAATSTVTWTVTAVQGSTGVKRFVVNGRFTVKNPGTSAAPIGNIVVTLQSQPASAWITHASNVANSTLGDAATTALVMRPTNNHDNEDTWTDDDDGINNDVHFVKTITENAASGSMSFSTGSGPISLVPPQSVPAGASATINFTATFNNDVMALPIGRKVRAEMIVTFGNANPSNKTASNVDMNGNGSIDFNEATVRSVLTRLGQKTVPALTVVTTPVTLNDTAADVVKTGTVTLVRTTFTGGATSRSGTTKYTTGASGGTIKNCAHLTGTNINLEACNTQTIAVAEAPFTVPLVESSWTLTPGQEATRCRGSVAPQDYYITGFRAPTIPGLVRVTVSVSETVQTMGDFACSTGSGLGSDFKMIYSGGPGANDVLFPTGKGVIVRAGQYLHLNMSLVNVGGTASLSGTTRLFMRTGAATDVTTAVEMFFIGTFDINIPANSMGTAGGGCASAYDQTFISLSPAMRTFGTHQLVRVSGQTILDRDFDVTQQLIHPISPEITVHQGDEIRTICSYDNTTTATLFYGDATVSEICFTAVYRYPVVPGNTIFECTL